MTHNNNQATNFNDDISRTNNIVGAATGSIAEPLIVEKKRATVNTDADSGSTAIRGEASLKNNNLNTASNNLNESIN